MNSALRKAGGLTASGFEWQRGIRAAIALGVVMSFWYWQDNIVNGVLMALGTFLICFIDVIMSGTGRWQHVQGLLLGTVGGVAGVAIAPILGNYDVVLVISVLVFIFAATVIAAGSHALSAAMFIFEILFIVFISPEPAAVAVRGAGWVLLGAVFGMAVIYASNWAIRRDPMATAIHGSARAVAACLANAAKAGAIPGELRVATQNALAETAGVISAERRHGGISARVAEQANAAVALRDLLDSAILLTHLMTEAGGPSSGSPHAELVSQARSSVLLCAKLVGSLDRDASVPESVAPLPAGADGDATEQQLISVINHIIGATRRLLRPANDTDDNSAMQALDRGPGAWDIIRSNLNPKSLVFAQAVRLSTLVAAATAVVLFFNVPHGYWVPMTIMVVFKPELSDSKVRAIQRIAGTLIGALLAFVLVFYVTTSIWFVVILPIAGALALTMYKCNYGIYAIFITNFTISTIEIMLPKQESAVGDRLGATVAGVLIAIVAAYIFLPKLGKPLPVVMGDAAGAVREYVGAMVARFSGYPSEDISETRKRGNTATLALSNLIGEIQRERNRSRSASLTRADAVAADLSVLAARATSLLALQYSATQRGVTMDTGYIPPALVSALAAVSRSIADGSPEPIADIETLEEWLALQPGLDCSDAQLRDAITTDVRSAVTLTIELAHLVGCSDQTKSTGLPEERQAAPVKRRARGPT